MDQDKFRQLLGAGSSTGLGTGRQRGSLLTAGRPVTNPKAKTIDASEPAFKPRKVKKQSQKYRDRALERRGGLDNDFTQVEGVLEDFEKANADNEDVEAIEEQRKFLGGDGDHSILVKGLDFALLEQNKAQASIASVVDDDDLESAFLGVTETPEAAPKKKTRQELIQELKEKREKGSDVPPETAAEQEKREIGIEEAKKAGKFKPIGFKPIGTSEDKSTKKKRKVEKDGEKKRKKRKVETEEVKSVEAPVKALPHPAQAKQPEPEQLDPEFDIFADADEYTGLDVDGDDNDDHVAEDPEVAPEPEPPTLGRGWFDEPKEPTPPPVVEAKPPSPEPEDEEMEDKPMRLAPLASSSVPSVKDILAMDKAAAEAEKRKARKEKRKEKQELSAEGKATRDYQKLMAYEKKKAKASA